MINRLHASMPAILRLGAVVMLLMLLHWIERPSISVGTEALATVQAEKNFPLPEALALPPGFAMGMQHPRLPHPPKNFEPAQPSLSNMHPALSRRVLETYLKPSREAVDALYKDLAGVIPQGRGMEEAKVLALAYDWLHGLWTPTQRQALLIRTLAACDYEIMVIRQLRLSPYNVVLYNAPLQGLMTCALALYGDHPRATPIMAFTHDLWKNRVLPVWRQIMGQSGGWHEGGEYVGIGIGQAIFQLPNMWRAATGEDLFKSEPRLGGFLDFLIHRTQPDGRYLAWGDAGFFNRQAWDAVALALEYRNRAAYTLLLPKNTGEPTSWPWGPPLDTQLLDRDAPSRLPLSKFFDGIGTLFARSDWTANATHVSFRAGDNFWSHTHLDQGAFTIYKGGELAIDSGLYYRALTDHHVNYTYQSIAHNTITITDPKDVVPGPAYHDAITGQTLPSRPIANDGGQRRIGSGWGVEEAPMDSEEWQRKRETYHTGVTENYFEADGLTVAVADITPAYTNAQSGRGSFAHRSLRAQRVWRIFAYDRINDMVVVFDNIASTKAEFKKRWLLHSVLEPSVEGRNFSVDAAEDKRLGHGGGTLKGWVLLPEAAQIDLVGGEGQAFWVDGQNYDDGGAVDGRTRWLPGHSKHPGQWRLEVSPQRASNEDLFLVVMAPTLKGTTSNRSVQLVQHRQWLGADVRGPMRSCRFWFLPERNGVLIDISDGDGFRRHEVWGNKTTGSTSLFSRWQRLFSTDP